MVMARRPYEIVYDAGVAGHVAVIDLTYRSLIRRTIEEQRLPGSVRQAIELDTDERRP